MRSFASRAGFVLWLAFLVFGLAVTPRAVGDLVLRDGLPDARVTRERIGQRLASLRDQFVLLVQDVDEETRRVEKVRVAYGLASSSQPPEESQVDPKAFPNSVFLPLIEETATLATHARIAVVELEARVAALRAFESTAPERVSFTPGLSPLHGEFVMTSPFGYRQSAFTEEQEYHSGVDLAAAVGTPVIAPAGGRVIFVGRFPVTRDSAWWRLGNVVAVRHGDELITLFGHLGRILVRAGQQVARGDVLSEIGESGVIANPHLHYAVWRRVAGGSYEPVDPRLLMLDRQWDDEEDLLAKAGARPGSFEPLPRQLSR
jgi:murein DD-endopeptidase MepM/ murein hydrolase activator NlpD